MNGVSECLDVLRRIVQGEPVEEVLVDLRRKVDRDTIEGFFCRG